MKLFMAKFGLLNFLDLVTLECGEEEEGIRLTFRVNNSGQNREINEV